MKSDWPTQAKDLLLAQTIIADYAHANACDALGLFELVVNEKEKRMDFQLSAWVITLAKQFKSLYGADEGDTITRRVISRCITAGETMH
jgi:hypothetical protein